jgi:methionine transaminase
MPTYPGALVSKLPKVGTFFQNLAYDAITDEKDTDLAVLFTEEKGVASVPLSVFYHDGHCDRVLRFCFAKSEETLAKGAEILRGI